MYPHTFFGLFPPFPLNHRVFVAMSFDPTFDNRWSSVIAPAIRSIKFNEVPLEAHRVDLRSVSDSILTEILDEIRKCRMFVADITSLDRLNDRPIRNTNVMYEVGLAHALRLPEEVVLLRSDEEERPFDIGNVRIHQYNPEGAPESAKRVVTEAIVQSHRELDLKRNLAVRSAADSLDYESWITLIEADGSGALKHPLKQKTGQILSAISKERVISRLLEIGALRAERLKITTELIERADEGPAEHLVTYRITTLGSALVQHCANEMGIFSAEVRPLLEERFLGEIKKEGTS